MWNNQKGLQAAIASYGTSSPQDIQRYGDDIWEIMCYHWDGFKRQTIITELMNYKHLKKRTAERYVGMMIKYCLAAPEDFHGPGSVLTPVSAQYFKMVDGNMEGIN